MTTTQTRPATRAGASDFAALRVRVEQAGLLVRRPWRYAVRFTAVAALYVGGWLGFVAVGDSWATLALAAVLAVAFAQVALLAHDIAHRQVFRTRTLSEWVGRLVGNLGIGMSYGWWMDKHTRHHANPNHEEKDPDVAPDVLVWSTEQAEHSRGLARRLGAWQGYLFFPLLTLEGVNLHVSSVRALLRPGVKRRGAEAALLLAHLVGYVALVAATLPLGKALAFVALNQALFGLYLGSTFAPNHKGMPTLKAGEQLDFLRRQVLTSRNVRGGRLTDVALGGLNYQIEHHLFPSMPTPHLRRARPVVKQYCEELGLPYHETSLVRSYAEALRHLHAAGAPLRRRA